MPLGVRLHGWGHFRGSAIPAPRSCRLESIRIKFLFLAFAGIGHRVMVFALKGSDGFPGMDRRWQSGAAADLRLLVCGAGRCGTTTLARELTATGLRCGHQSCFTVLGIFQPPGVEADSSWLAAPYLHAVRCPILHLVRHPLDVLNSMEGIRFLDGGITENNCLYERFARRFLPELDALADSRERHMRFIVSWNAAINRYTHRRMRLEDGSRESLRRHLSDLGLAPYPGTWGEKPYPFSRANSRPRTTLTVGDLPKGSLRDEFVAQAREFGYSI